VLKAVTEILQHNSRLQDRLMAAEEQLCQQAKQIESWMTEARTDPLTGLPNRGRSKMLWGSGSPKGAGPRCRSV